MKAKDQQQEQFLRNIIKSGLHDDLSHETAFTDKVMRHLKQRYSLESQQEPGIFKMRHFLWLLLIPLGIITALFFLIQSMAIPAWLANAGWWGSWSIALITVLFYFHIIRTFLILVFFGFKRSGFFPFTLLNNL